MSATAGGGNVAMGFGAGSVPLLRRLEQAGLAGEIRWPPSSRPDAVAGVQPPTEPAGRWLARRWSQVRAVLAVGSCGLVTRLIAPLVRDKVRDPAVLVLDPQGRFVIPLLGGHGAVGERLCREIAALLEAQPVLTGGGPPSDLPLDAFGQAWGWRRGAGDWSTLMVKAARGTGVRVRQDCGIELWRQLDAARGLTGRDPLSPPADELVIEARRGAGCHWHPPCLWLGMGCERNTSLSLLERLVDETLAREGLAPEAVAALASVNRKGDEVALVQLAESRGWPLRLFPAEELATVAVPHPSARVAREMGTASVAEAAALLGASDGREAAAELLVAKTIERARAGEQGAATLAVALGRHQWAPARGSLHLVGSGPGSLDLLTGDARRALAAATVWVGYGPYLDLLEPLRRPDQLRREGRLTEERARCEEALSLATQGVTVALVSSGDSGIYGMAGLALQLWLRVPAEGRPGFTVHPGVSALQLAAARAGAPLMHDFCTISLSDRLTPWEVIERRLRCAGAGDFIVALYNPRSHQRDWQLERARQLLLKAREPQTPVVLARQLGRQGEEVQLHTLASLPVEQVDMLSLVLIGNRSSAVQDGRMVTPRGYPGAELGPLH